MIIGSGIDADVIMDLNIVQIGKEEKDVHQRARQIEMLSDTELSEPEGASAEEVIEAEQS